MNLRRPHLWIGVVSVLAVATAAIVDSGRRSPGPLTSVHQREDDLVGRWSCSQCHGGWGSGMTQACLECHEPIQAQIESGDGLHGSVGARADLCATCHSEHHGADFAITNRQSFALAGIPDPEAFDHELLGFPLAGRHLELDCSECHEHADAAVLPAGAFRFLGLDRDCASCHDDPHKGRLAARACADCHGQEDFDTLHATDHDRSLPLIGGHADLSCRECHAEGAARALEVVAGRGRTPRPRVCASCHVSPHRREFVSQVADRVREDPAASCEHCHADEHTSFRQEGLEFAPALHALSGFALDPPHDAAACSDCHAATDSSFDTRFPGRGADECASCHEDPHEGQFADGPFDTESGCLACHDRHAFDPPAFSPRDHKWAALQLTGRHLVTDCNDCHEVPDLGGPRVFRGTPSDCARCHWDAHEGFFDDKLAALEPVAHGDCARCHGTHAFGELPVEFDHEHWTDFPVLGAHAAGACEACHPRSGEPDPAGRTLGRAADRFNRADIGRNRCADCHRDPHQQSFDARGLPRAVDGRTGCARCHVEVSFRAFPTGFDHELWTGFLLEGEHAAADCSGCHTRLRQPDPHGRTWARAAGRNCADCHDDSHAGQFRVEGRTDCSRCHQSAVSFRELTFQHDWDSRFRLDEAHGELACSVCHPLVQSDGGEVVRYRPLPRECVDCHGVHEEAMRKRTRR